MKELCGSQEAGTASIMVSWLENPRYLDLTLPECFVPELGEQKQGKANGKWWQCAVWQHGLPSAN